MKATEKKIETLGRSDILIPDNEFVNLCDIINYYQVYRAQSLVQSHHQARN